VVLIDIPGRGEPAELHPAARGLLTATCARRGVTTEALERLNHHACRNVRELRNAIDTRHLLARGTPIRPSICRSR